MKEVVRFCLIGAGRAGLVHAQNIACRIKGAELSAICETNPETLTRTADEFGVARRYADYREAVADPQLDAVVIVTPTFLHRDIACASAEAGKHVFLEKPMAITVEECQEIIAAVARAGVRLQIGFMRRFDAHFLQAKSLLESGDFGRVMLIKSTGRGPGLPPPWIYDIAKSNGILAEVNSHDFDSVRWLVGDELARVYAEAGNFKCLEAQEEYPRFYDSALVSLRFVNGALGSVDGACPAHYGYDARVEVLCERGLLCIGHIEEGIVRVSADGQVTTDTVRSWRTLFKDAYLAEMEHFVECARSGSAPRVTGEDGLHAVRAVVAANQSLLAGAPVDLPPWQPSPAESCA